MNNKAILSILIVILIGVVAASYHDDIENGMTMFQPLDDDSNIYTDEEGQVQTTDEATTETSQPLISDLGITKTPVLQLFTDRQSRNTTTTTNGQVSGIQNINNHEDTNKNTTLNDDSNNKSQSQQNNTYKVTVVEAQKIARNWAQSQGFTNIGANYKSIESGNGITTYIFTIQKDRQIVGEVEINTQTGTVEGGAILHEAPDTDNYNNNTNKKNNTTN